uniref:Uncharacterized protein n=1 Tax=Anguilla anguilla TaxID=7936 RepID=A0A0E9WCE9_ANGAN
MTHQPHIQATLLSHINPVSCSLCAKDLTNLWDLRM